MQKALGALDRPVHNACYAAATADRESGEWLSYTINVAQAGLYRIEAFVSSEFTDSRWHAEIDDVDVTGPMAVPSTGWWGTFQWFGKDGVSLTAGQHFLRIVAEQQYFNLDAIRISQ